jgi:hypothetical protein
MPAFSRAPATAVRLYDTESQSARAIREVLLWMQREPYGSGDATEMGLLIERLADASAADRELAEARLAAADADRAAADAYSRAASALGLGAAPGRHAARPLRAVPSRLPAWLPVPVAGAALAIGHAFRLKRAAAAVALAGSVVTAGTVAVAVIPAQMIPDTTARPAVAATSPAAQPVSIPLPAAGAPHHAGRHRGGHPGAVTVPAPPARPHPRRPSSTPSPSPSAKLAAVDVLTPVLHAGQDGSAMLILAAPASAGACWTLAVSGPVVIHDTGGEGCLTAGQAEDIAVTAAGNGTITVTSGTREVTVQVTGPAGSGPSPSPRPR